MENLHIIDVTELETKINSNTQSFKNLPYISQNFDIKERRVLMNCATGSLSRKSMTKTNNLISNKCSVCKNNIEDTDHMLNCNNNQYCLKSDVNNFLSSHAIKMDEPFIFNKHTDFVLGVGKLQKIKDRKSKIWRIISTKIDSLQKFVLNFLKVKTEMVIHITKEL